MPDPNDPLKRQFLDVFGTGGAAGSSAPGAGGKVHVIRSPGRVNLIGEHTDYNDGLVFPMAIEPEVRIVCRARPDDRVRLASTAFPDEVVEFSVQGMIAKGEPSWADYSKGVAHELRAAGIPLGGMEALVSNTLPVGGGLSSSAAIEVGTAQAFLTLAGLKMDPQRMALICQKAENDFVGVPVGIMDITIVAGAKPGQAMLLDCRDLSKQFIPLDPNELRIVIANSMVKHELGSGEYAQRRKQCEQGVRHFQQHYPSLSIKALRDVTMKMVETAAREETMDSVVLRRCRHVVGEIARTTEAAAKLGQKHYEEVGRLMVQSHESLRDDYEVSIDELDFLVAEAVKVKGVYGSRMTGGGFGGCTVSLVQPRAVEPLIEHLGRVYKEKFNIAPSVFATSATGGVSVLE